MKDDIKVNNIETKIDSSINRTDKKDIKHYASIEDRINSIDIEDKSQTNNIIEILTKNIFDNETGKKSNMKSQLEQKQHIKSMLEKENWDALYNSEMTRMDRYSEYETIYSYIPELASCIDSFRDAIISPDDLIACNKLPVVLNKEKISIDNTLNFEENIALLEERYNLKNIQKEVIGNTLKLGDQFIAVLKYEDEMQKYLLQEQNDKLMPPEFLDPYKYKENNEEQTYFKESFIYEDEFKDLQKIITKETYNIYKESKTSEKEITGKANDIYNKISSDIVNSVSKIKIKSSKQFISDLTSGNVKSKNIDLSKIEIKGSIIKKLHPRYTVKLEIDGMEFGYLYAVKEERANRVDTENTMKDFFNSRTDINSTNNVQSNVKEDILTNIFGKGIAKKLDMQFIEKNKEYKDLIYVLLKNNSLQKNEVSFVYFAPEEVVHFSIDKQGVYGTSRMAKSLFAAKLYIPGILNEFMQKITRGRDKRVIYSEVGLDSDIEGAIQEVVRDIKSKEVSPSTLQNLTTILRIVGNFEDYYIPMFDGRLFAVIKPF